MESWSEPAEAAQAAYYHLLASSPEAETRPVGDGFAVATRICSNTENGVVAARFAGDCAEVVEWFRERRAPAIWLGADDNLAARLRAAGCRPDSGGIDMGGELDGLELPPARPPGRTRIAVAADARELDLVLDLMAAEGMLEDDADRERARRVFRSLGLGRAAPLCHYLAREDAEPVGMATAFFAGETVLLQHVVVVPARRRRGLGRALALARLHDARARGCRTAVLGPTPESRRLYEPLGFTAAPTDGSRVLYLPVGT